MIQMFKQMFIAFTTLFSATEKAAMALDHMATWTEEGARNFVEKARLDHAAEMAELQHKLRAKQLALATTTAE
jgi:hypothetical protein